MGPERTAGAFVPGAGVFAYSAHCAALSGLLRAGIRWRTQNGLPTSPEWIAFVAMAEDAAADFQRQHIVSAGTSVVAKPASASPKSEWVSGVRHAATALRVSERQIRYLIDNGTLRAEKDARHQWRIDPQSIENERVRRAHGKGEHRGTDSG